MNTLYSRTLTVLIALCILTPLSYGKDEKGGIDKQAKLTQAVLESWLNSQERLANWGDANAETLEAAEKLLPTPEKDAEPDNPLALTAEQMLSPLERAGLYDQANQLMQEAGFVSIKDWAEITLRITRAAAALQFEASNAASSMKPLEEMLAHENLSDQQRSMLESAIARNQAMAAFLLNDVSIEDKRDIEPFLPMLEAFIDDN